MYDQGILIEVTKGKSAEEIKNIKGISYDISSNELIYAGIKYVFFMIMNVWELPLNRFC